jgi:hypothetical protein
MFGFLAKKGEMLRVVGEEAPGVRNDHAFICPQNFYNL